MISENEEARRSTGPSGLFRCWRRMATEPSSCSYDSLGRRIAEAFRRWTLQGKSHWIPTRFSLSF